MAKITMITLWKWVKIPLIILGIAIAGYILWDVISNWIIEILTLGGLGGAAVAAKKMQAKEHQAIADEHQDMADSHLVESVNEIKQGADKQKEAVEIAKNSKPTDKETPGFKKKKISSR